MLFYSEIESEIPTEERWSNRFFVPFGKRFYLHPGKFALGMTLEWLRMPKCLTGSVVGKSSWGRRGLVIETAPCVHPGYLGCLKFTGSRTCRREGLAVA